MLCSLLFGGLLSFGYHPSTHAQVGIGVADPQYMLDLRGILRLRVDSANGLAPSIFWNKPNNTLAVRNELLNDSLLAWNTEFPFNLLGTNRRAMVWDYTRSYLGIQSENRPSLGGTPAVMSPAAPLHFLSSFSYPVLLDYTDNSLAGPPTGSGSGIRHRIGNEFTLGVRSLKEDVGSSMRWYVGRNSNFSSLPERLTLLSSGRLGINQPTPLLPLHTTSSDSSVALFENSTAIATGVKTQQLYRTGTFYTAATGTRATAGNAAAYFIATFAGTTADLLRERVTVLDNGNVGIGITSPTATLDLNGSLRIRSGASNGAVLTSDANGNATWQVPPSNPTRAAGAWISPALVLGANQTRTLRFGLSDYSDGFVINDSSIVIPAAGIYQFTMNFAFINLTLLDGDPNKLVSFRIQPSTSAGKTVVMQLPVSATATNTVFYSTQMLQLAANEVVKVTCSTPAGLALSMQSAGPFKGISVHLIK